MAVSSSQVPLGDAIGAVVALLVRMVFVRLRRQNTWPPFVLARTTPGKSAFAGAKSTPAEK
jgi:hypothetical protein